MAENTDGLNKAENNQSADPNYWRSFEDLHNSNAVLAASRTEFQEGVTEDFQPSKLSGLSRRKFLALIGASAALAGAGCSDYLDKGAIVPYTKKPEEITLGKATYYASTCTACMHACGILIKTREGRPIKIDGNPDHPVSKGKICAKGHANILGLYDPERLKNPLKRSGGAFVQTKWSDADEEIISKLNSIGNKQIVIVTHTIASPTTKKLFDDFSKKYPNTKVYSYELVNNSVRNSAWKKCYGTDNFPLLKWNEAKIIVALESDFLGVEGNKVEAARLFAESRNVEDLDNFNRLYVFETSMSLTGSNSDYRLKLAPAAQYDLVMALINEVVKKGISGISVDSSIISKYSLADVAKKYSLSMDVLNHLVLDLIQNKGKSLVHAGNTLPEQTHIAVNLLNEMLGNHKLYNYDEGAVILHSMVTQKELSDLVSDMNSGNVGVIIHWDSNPVYHFTEDTGYKAALLKVPLVISLTESHNESSVYAKYVLPINHNLEAWGDAKTRSSFYSMQQPVISPIFDTRQKEAALLLWLGGSAGDYKETMFHDYLKNNWEKVIYSTLSTRLSFNQAWLGALHDGIMLSTKSVFNIGSFNNSAVNNLKNNSFENAGYTVVLRESYSTGDGRFANNGWMLELPHPVSKITWDNYAAISSKTASKLNLKSNDVVELSVENRKIRIPVFIQPGAADDTFAIELGYGRTIIGVVGEEVGFYSGALMSKNGGLSPWIYTSVKARKTGETYELITAQEHHTFDKGFTKDQPKLRGIVREGTVKEYQKNPYFIQEGREEELKSFYNPHEYSDVKWGMSVDLNKCIGCSDCVIACHSENNVPVVGKDQVAKGREMHWIRIDRYYSGSPDEPSVSTQPMLCQQCDHAPCENVCPVVATTHSPDGLNQMIYNRCVGTRYCANNCPYKVRRFNFFNFRDSFKDGYQQAQIFDLVYNPEVTIRSRGVMEKCTFCIQRIMEAREDAKHENRKLKGSDVKTACQVACNTNAIQFGDMNDKESEFIKYRNHRLGYYILEEINVRPNITYLAKLRNTHSEEV